MTKCIFVSTGAGFAPLVGMLEEKEILANDPFNPFCAVHVYFGCRHSQEDFIYKATIERLQKSGVVSSFAGAFSRQDVMTSNPAAQQGVRAAPLRSRQGKNLWPALRR